MRFAPLAFSLREFEHAPQRRPNNRENSHVKDKNVIVKGLQNQYIQKMNPFMLNNMPKRRLHFRDAINPRVTKEN